MSFRKYASPFGIAVIIALSASPFCLDVAAQGYYGYAHPASDQRKPSATATEWQDALGRSPSTRMVEKRTTSDGRQVDTQSWQSLSGAGNYVPGPQSEVETVRLDPQTVRVLHRQLATDSNGRQKVVAVTEEETRTLPDGSQTVTRTISQPDLNNGFQVVRRDIEKTRIISPGITETRTTVLTPGVEENLAAHEQILTINRKQGDLQNIETKHLLPDGNGGWQVSKVEEKVVTAPKNGAGTEEDRVNQRDAQQNLSVSEQVVTKDWQDGTGQGHEVVDTYLTNTPGTTVSSDSHVMLDKRLSIVRDKSANGGETTDVQQEDRDPNVPFSGLRVTQRTMEVSTPGQDGTTKRRGTVEASDGNGGSRVIWVFASQPVTQ
jgi:hypothetical protein